MRKSEKKLYFIIHLLFVVYEQAGFLKFIGKKKSIPEMECSYCNGTILPIDINNLK